MVPRSALSSRVVISTSVARMSSRVSNAAIVLEMSSRSATSFSFGRRSCPATVFFGWLSFFIMPFQPLPKRPDDLLELLCLVAGGLLDGVAFLFVGDLPALQLVAQGDDHLP